MRLALGIVVLKSCPVCVCLGLLRARVAVCYSVLQRVKSVMQSVAVCCSVLQCAVVGVWQRAAAGVYVKGC